ncbi:MAG: hypothetical protein IJY08_01180 [Clostridia bacterium]|nr:hypothetical protein [Clostridia bacterium]
MRIFDRLEALTPPGISPRRLLGMLAAGAALSVVRSFEFLIKLYDALRTVFDYHPQTGEPIIIEGRRMPMFWALAEQSFIGFAIAAAVALAFIGYYYASYRMGSRSIYLMRRLPHPWEMHKRALTLPVMGALAMLLLGALTVLVYLGIYMLVTPEAVLTAGAMEQLKEIV